MVCYLYLEGGTWLKRKFWNEFVFKWLVVGTAKDLLLIYVCLVIAYYLRIIMFHLFSWTSTIG